MSLILASASPRRAELLDSAGFTFTVEPADVDETPRAGETPDCYVLRVAAAKAEAVAKRSRTPGTGETIEVVDEAPAESASSIHLDGDKLAKRSRTPGTVVLAADTTVVAAGQILGKPDGREDAVRMLTLLAGARHEVLTGVVAIGDAGTVAELVATRVHLMPMGAEDIAWYVDSGETEGKAGAYGIQGRAARFIDWIEGSWSNVVGLPLATVHHLLKKVS